MTRKRNIIACAIIAAMLLGWGGWMLYGKLGGQPPTPAQVKRSIWKYLSKQAGTKDFKCDLDPGAASLADVSNITTLTNKAGVVRTVTRPAKVGKLGLPQTGLSAYFRTNQAQATTYAEMYRYIGQQLTVSEQMLGGTNRPQQITGLILATEASEHARTNAQNLWLGARICEAYLWPNLALVEATNRAAFTTDALLTICDTAFQEAGETNNIIRNYEYMIAKTVRPQQVDALRYRLAHIYQDLGREEKALPLLQQIKTYRMTRVPAEIAAMEQRLKKR
jgi:hypothetical protein